jgi:hypothetical protein
MAGTRRASVSRVGRVASGAAFAVAALVAMLVLSPAAFGWQRYAIVSGSMTGTYDRGSATFNLAGLWRRLGALEAAA